MVLFKLFLPSVAVAALVAIVISALFLRAKRVRASRTRTVSGPVTRASKDTAAACALGAGYFAGHIFITGWTPFPPADTTNWLPYFALAAAGIGSLAALLFSKASKATKFTRIIVFILVCVGAMRLLLEPKFRYGWSAEQGWTWVIGLACVTLFLALCIAVMERRSTIAVEPALTLIIVSAGAAGALMMSGSLLLAQFAAVLSAASLGSLALTLRCKIEAGGIDVAGSIFSLLFIGLLACGHFFADLPALSAILLATAPAIAPIPISTPRRATAARLAVIGAFVTGALFVAFHASPRWTE